MLQNPLFSKADSEKVRFLSGADNLIFIPNLENAKGNVMDIEETERQCVYVCLCLSVSLKSLQCEEGRTKSLKGVEKDWAS